MEENENPYKTLELMEASDKLYGIERAKEIEQIKKDITKRMRTKEMTAEGSILIKQFFHQRAKARFCASIPD